MTRMNLPATTKPLTPKQQKWKRLLSKLEERCLQPISEFRQLGTVVAETKDGPLIHIDRGSKILGVAHLDTVARIQPRSVLWQTPKRRSLPVITSIQLDDRLGVWVLLDLLPAMGLEFDVLLCDSEERGASTAEHFKPPREYNWGFEFDRAGMDTVLYDYEDDETWEQALKTAGFDIGIGSFSDISTLTHVGCCFANFGVGYHYQHTAHCYASLDDTVLMALEFETWYKDNKDMAYKYTPTDRFGRYSRRDWWYGGCGYGSHDGWTRTKTGTWKKTYGKTEPKVEKHDCPGCGKLVTFYGGLSEKLWYECPYCKLEFEGKEYRRGSTTSPSWYTERYCPACDKRVSFPQGIDDECEYTCPYCDKEAVGFEYRSLGDWRRSGHRVDDLPRCKRCDARCWNDDGVCDVCGYDPVLDMMPDDEIVTECPICGGDMDDEYCCYCGYVEEGAV